jgi:1,2-diacylglycerol 3-alpha-glucosyltransferase
MRIAIAGQTYFPASNGQSVFTVHLAEGLAALGHQVMVIVPSPEGRPTRSMLNGVRVERVRSITLAPRFPDVYLNLPAGNAVNRAFDDFRPDIVHIQDHYPLCRAMVAVARRRGLPLAGTNHFLPENMIHYLNMPRQMEPWLEKLAWWTMLSLYNRLDVATTPTETAANILRGQAIHIPVHAISCGVDGTRFRPDPTIDRAAMRRRYGLDPNRHVFLFVGRVDQEKRLDVLLRALALLKRDDIQVGIAGHGRYLAPLQEMVRQLGVGDRTVFTGYVPAEDLPGLLNSVDVFTMPSEAELQSIATLESMSCGRPVLAANARALPELVKDGVNGYLFAPGDPADAARRMAQLVDERDRWPEMGRASLARVAPHSLANTLRRYEELYCTLSPALRRRVKATALPVSHV